MSDLALPASSPLTGSTRKKRRLLTLTDGSGATVAEARLGKEATPAAAIFAIAGGEHRIERTDRAEYTVTGPSGEHVAVYRKKALTLADGEVLEWHSSGFAGTRFRLGENLWVAKPRWPPPLRGFRAEVSPAFLAREDRALIAALAGILTQWGIETEAAMEQIGSGG